VAREPIRSRQLTVTRHDRDATGMTYVYPVVSRRAGGVSVGVNLNPNSACNWRCVYCQVPDLTFGKAPQVNLEQLREELSDLVTDIVQGQFLERSVPADARRLEDVAISGNGEPTSSGQFGDVLEVIADVLRELGLLGQLRVTLITNGSMLNKPPVRLAVQRLAEMRGEVWFKLDTATSPGLRRINQCSTGADAHLAKLRAVAELCPTWIQSCLFAWNGQPPTPAECEAYLNALRRLARDAVPLRGVQLYTLARASQQPEASELEPLSEAWLRDFAQRVETLGFTVRVSGS
jgi:wyosine [tRNA(Phe)-imidazoG37] synthetase (radical SAM superfamily)